MDSITMNKQTIDNQVKIVNLVKNAPEKLSDEQITLLESYVGWGTVYKALDPHSEGFYKEAYEQFCELLTPEELNIARSVTPNAYYTHPKVAQAIWKIVKNLGFTGGNVLEPSCGGGIFLTHCPKGIYNNSNFVGVELDPISAKVAELLHPNVIIRNQGFETLTVEEDSFDLAIGNVPFGAVKLWDRELGIEPQKIHDFFLMKAMKLVRKGGLVAFLTSTGFLDSKSGEPFRQHISQYGELILATRLPSGTFKESSGTEVTIDLVVFQKHTKKPEHYSSAFSSDDDKKHSFPYPDWVESVSIKTLKEDDRYKNYRNSVGFERYESWNSRIKNGLINHNKLHGNTQEIEQIPINKYFLVDLTKLLGMISVDKLYGGGSRGALIPIDGVDPVVELELIATSITPQYEPAITKAITLVDKKAEQMPKGSFFMLDSKVVQKVAKPSGGVQIKEIGNSDKILKFIQLVDVLTLLIEAQKTDDEDRISDLRQELNKLYDKWLDKYGYLHKNFKDLEDDIRYYLLLALETPENVKGFAKKYKKSDIFFKRTSRPAALVERCDRTQDALAVTLNRYGEINVDYIASLMDKSSDWVCEDLKVNKLAYFNPVTEKWEQPEIYLSGNIRKKLDKATEAGIPENIEALEAVLPKWLLPDADLDTCINTGVEIGVDKFREDQAKFDISLGQTWVDVEIYRQFMFFLFNLPVTHTGYIKQFKYPSNEYKIINPPLVSDDNQYGTTKANAIQLLELALNGMKPKVMIEVNTVDGKKRIEDKEGTLAAIAAQDKIKLAFQKWVFTDLERAIALTKKYNIEYNVIVAPTFNGKHLTFPGINPAIQLRSHQKDAAWRGVNQKSFLLGWEVGGGKTIGFIVAAMEQKRLGLISKPMFVVLNSTISDIETEFRKLYPTAKLLVGNEKSTSPQNRWKFLYKIAVGEWDAIIITHTQFKSLSMSPQARMEFIKHELDLINEQVEEAKSSGKRNSSLKSKATITGFYEKKLEMAMDQLNNNQDNIDWELLGIDAVIIDEFHLFKNLFRHTKKENIAGMPNSASERAFDCLLKLRHTLTNGGRVILATGTPVSNTLAEAWTMLRYLNLEYLEELGLEHFDSFFELFFDSTSEFEVMPYGYKLRERVREIKNHPELVEILGQFMDVRNADDLDLPRPKYEVISVGCPPSPEQMDYLQELCDRYEKFMSREVDPRDDNPLKIIGDGRAAQLDPRLRIYGAENLISSKVNQCIRNVYRIWELTAPVKGVQAIFCDFSIPKKGIFSVYQYVKDILVKLGIPENEIAFIHDYKTKSQKKFLLHLINAGEIRVVLGSTSKLGTGVNMQKRLFALHHLDAPWRPSDIAQREGRIVRQGNLFEEVLIFRYVTQGGDDGRIPGFDAFIWGIIESKAKVFTGMFRAKSGQRRLETDDSVVMSMSMLKAIATGDDGFLRLEKINQEVKKAEIVKNEWNNQAYSVKSEYRHTISKIEKSKQQIDLVQDDLTYLAKNPFQTLPIKIDGMQFSFKKGVKELLSTPAGKLKNQNIWFGEFRVSVTDAYRTLFYFTRNNNKSGVELQTKQWLEAPDFDLAVVLQDLTKGLVETIDRCESRIPDIEERTKRFEYYPDQKQLDDLLEQQKNLQEQYGEKTSVQADNTVEMVQQGAIRKQLSQKKKDLTAWISDLKHYLKVENPEVKIKGETYSIQQASEVLSNEDFDWQKGWEAKNVIESFELGGFNITFKRAFDPLSGRDASCFVVSRKGEYDGFKDIHYLFDAFNNFDEYLKDRIYDLAGQLLEAGVIKEIPDLDNLLDEEEESTGKEKVHEFWHKGQVVVDYIIPDLSFIKSMELALAQEETPSWVEKTEHQVQLLLSKLGEQVDIEVVSSETVDNEEEAIEIEVVSSETVDDEEEDDEILDFDWDEIPTVHYTANKYFLQAVEDEDQEDEEDEDEILDWQEGWELELF